MAIINPPNEQVKTLRGVHLYHADLSSCSQRVRIALEEKGVPWVSHLLDLAKDEHVRSDFPSINPKGLVPVLVHDGVVHVESADILNYIDANFDGPALQAGDPASTAQWVARCNAQQGALKITSFEFLFKPKARKNARELQRFAQLQQANPELLAFHQQFSSQQGLPQAKIQQAVDHILADIKALDQQLEQQPYIAGEAFSLADVAWMVSAHRYNMMGFPNERFPHYQAWFRRVAQRPSYTTALRQWEPNSVSRLLQIYTAFRRLRGNDLRTYLPQPGTL